MIFLTKADFTSDANVASEVNPAAFAAVLQLQSGEMDLEITALLDANKRDAAIAKKKEIIVMLVGVLCSGVVFSKFFWQERAAELDPSGFAPIMLLAARKTLKQLESKRSANKVKKAKKERETLRLSFP